MFGAGCDGVELSAPKELVAKGLLAGPDEAAPNPEKLKAGWPPPPPNENGVESVWAGWLGVEVAPGKL